MKEKKVSNKGRAACALTRGEAEDHFYMKKALAQAHKAYKKDEVPIGAIVIDEQGFVIGRGYNCVMKACTQSAHAEVIALQKAGKRRGDWRLNGCWLYVTLEPCAMCMALAQLSRIEGGVYAASSPLFGYTVNAVGQTVSLDKMASVQVYKKDVKIRMGIGQEESLSLLRQFFKKKRKKGEFSKD